MLVFIASEKLVDPPIFYKTVPGHEVCDETEPLSQTGLSPAWDDVILIDQPSGPGT